MKRKAIVFEAERSGYGIDQVTRNVMTVGQLIGLLQDMDDDDLVIISHDNGYTYGSLECKYEAEENENGEWEEV